MTSSHIATQRDFKKQPSSPDEKVLEHMWSKNNLFCVNCGLLKEKWDEQENVLCVPTPSINRPLHPKESWL